MNNEYRPDICKDMALKLLVMKNVEEIEVY